MIVGCLGDIVFEVSESVVRTLSDMKWSGSARIATHQRQGTHALTEYTGMDPDKIQFTVYLSAYLGVDPMTEIKKIWNYERSGTSLPLVIGDHAYGKYRWLIQKHSFAPQAFDARGNILVASLSLSLIEYLRE